MSDFTTEISIEPVVAFVAPTAGAASGNNDSNDPQKDELICSGADAVAYRDGKDWRIVVSLTRCEPADLAALAQRIQLMRLSRCEHLAPVQAPNFDCKPASLRIGPMQTDSIPTSLRAISQNTEANKFADTSGCLPLSGRLRLAGQLIRVVEQTHRVGLIHGNLSLDTIHVTGSGVQSQLWIDYSGLDYGLGHADPQRSTITGCMDQSAVDIQSLGLVLNQFLAPALADQSEGDLTGRQRARLKHFLRRDDPDRTLWHWLDVFGPWIQERGIDSERIETSVSSQSHDAGGATAEVNVVQSSPAIAKNDQDSTTGDAVTPKLGKNGPDSSLQPGTTLGRYRIDELIGVGGMGHVYRGLDVVTSETLAIKVLKEGPDMEQAVRRFRKEARLLAEVQNNWITKLHHMGFEKGPGFEDGRHFMAMEWVEGITLADFLERRGEPLDEKDALGLIGDLARALVDAHQCGIVHRDIKPENVLLQCKASADADSDRIDDYCLKLSDFGIARHIDQTQSLEVTRAGSMLGTPRYMSPEQCKGTDSITPAADVYSMGVTMFELLTGRAPYEADDPMRLAAMHCFDPIPPVARLAPSVSESTIRMINRAMAKSAGQRYADAEEWLTEIQQSLGGVTSDIEMHPQLPIHDPNKVWSKSVTWQLNSSCEDLWPLVSNTDRINRSIGLPAVQYSTEQDPVLGLRKFGKFKLAGITVSWEEHPFEWIHNRRIGILREFDSGPMKWFMSVVTLQPDGEGGTTLTHEVKIESHNLVGRMLATIEADWKGFAKLDKLYRRLDDAIASGNNADGVGDDAFEDVATLTSKIQSRLDRCLDQMASAGVDVAASSSLVQYIRSAAPQPLSQIRPIALAAGLGIDKHAMIDACLVGVSVGLLKPRWEIICPTCRVSAQSTEQLSSIDVHTECSACDTQFRSDIATAIELVFQPHPEVRPVDESQYCVGGPEHSPHVIAQVRMSPGETLEVPVNLSCGQYKIRSTRSSGGLDFRVDDGIARSVIDVDVIKLGQSQQASPIMLRSGRIRIRIDNSSDCLHVIRLEKSLSREDCLTAASVATLTRFRQLFPEQTLSPSNAVSQGPMTLVCTGAGKIEDYCRQWGESAAHKIISQWHAEIAVIAKRHRGVVAKSIDHRQLLIFESVDDAVAAAAALTNLADENYPSMSMVVHRGETLIVTANDRLDYCGSALRSILRMASDDKVGIRMTEAVYADPVVASRYSDWLQTSMLTSDQSIRVRHFSSSCPSSLLNKLQNNSLDDTPTCVAVEPSSSTHCPPQQS